MTPTPRTAATPDRSTASATAKRQPTERAAVKKQANKRGVRQETGDVTVLAAVKRDLARIAQLDEALATSGLAATALALAKEMDAPANSATSKSMCAGQLRDTLDRILELAPVSEESDDLDDLTKRREARLARASGTAT